MSDQTKMTNLSLKDTLRAQLQILQFIVVHKLTSEHTQHNTSQNTKPEHTFRF